MNKMSTIENIDVNKIRITFTATAEELEKGMDYSYKKNRDSIQVQGFRKGKAPRKIIEMQYGKGIFLDDAINFVLQSAYPAAVKENNLEVVSQPEIDIKEMGDDGVTFTADVFVKPEVKVSDYKGLTFKKLETEPTDEEVEAAVKREQEKNSRIVTVTDRAVQNGDIATIDFKGYVDDVAFAGGEGKDYDLEIGSHSFIDTFEDQLVGANVGDDVVVNVTFPENYGQADLAGKAAKFEVEVKDIKVKEYPEINDEYVADTTEFETVEEYKNDLRGKLIATKIEEAKNAKENEIMSKLVEKAEMVVPDCMIESDIDNKINEFQMNLQQQGFTLDLYLQYMGQNMDTMRDAYRPMAERQVKTRLALEAVAAQENIEVTDEDVEAEVQRIADNYKIDVNTIKATLRDEDKENLAKDVKVQKAVKLIIDAAVEEA
jgi:trigger factor